MPEPRPEDLNPELRRIVDAARDIWIRRLIDHSRNNSLLFYRDLKVGTLDLTSEPSAVRRIVAGDSLPLDSLVSAYRYEGTDPVLRSRAKEEVLKKVRNALVALQRKAVSNLEEKGIETLFLAIGMATWPASDGGRPYEAPVLLLPATIEARGRAGNELRLSVAGEPQINPVLVYVLEENYAIHVSATTVVNQCSTEDESGRWRVDSEAVLVNIESTAGSIPDFEVNRRAILANFQFAKMAMVEDLKKNGEVIASSGIVAAVAGHSGSRQELSRAVVDLDPVELDERPASADFLVLDADSTQHRATVLVSKGQNGVVQGPPGTGKSQTIANIIAQTVADGRRVLFVAEKRAALDAVIKRLSHHDVGLGHLVLDLHGASVSRKDVMARLSETLEQIRHAVPADGAEAVHREFEARRTQLNEHASRINKIRLPTGFSINQMVGKVLRLPLAAKSSLRFRGDSLNTLVADRVDEVKQWLIQGSAHPALLLGVDSSPWNNADIRDGHRAQEAIDLVASIAHELWPKFERLLGKTVHELGIRPPGTMHETADFLALFRDARRVRELYQSEIFPSRPGDLASALDSATSGRIGRAWAFVCNSRYRNARRRLLELRTGPASSADLREEALLANDVLRRWRLLGASLDMPATAVAEKELETAFLALNKATKELCSIAKRTRFREMSLIELATWLTSLASDQRTPYLLPGVYLIRSRLEGAGLLPLLVDFNDNNVGAETWSDRFEYIWLYSALEKELASDQALATFNGQTHEQIVAEFNRLDRERLQLAARRVRRLHAERAVDAMNQHFDQADVVKREAAKRSRHLPLRELLSRTPDVLTRVAPCWVASPLSVSQLLDGSKRHFDIVVFDEASQILQEEAVPALYRSEQVVVAGDRHQLPPTTFFATAVEGEDEISETDDDTRDAHATATAAIGGFESLLGTMDAFLPNWLLEWHYRSEDERLIAFSNTHVYSGRLITFPSARGHEAIRHVLIPHDPSIGGQEESASAEVNEVVRQVFDHADAHPRESLGVITMGIKHANRIQAALDRALALRSDLSEFFSLEKEERFFIKNLETVQGDERDAIILSVGYGKSANGDLPHHFGPLTQEVGYRRLNVAVTRAKRRMCVISSFSHNEIDLNRSGSRGVRLLKAYLEYTASGGQRLPEQEQAGEVGLNAFEADVRDGLEGRGIITRSQFGASRYRIDLVAMHPELPGRPVLAIECDGAAYHSSATARDRDRLRQEHLQRLGWRFHRIWSTDWFHDRESEMERAISAYEDAVLQANLSDSGDSFVHALDTSAVLPPAQQGNSVQRGPCPQIFYYESIDYYRDEELLEIASWIESDGLLRTREELIREIFDNLSFARMGTRIRRRLERIAQLVAGRRNGGHSSL
jgi:very-short-patch-repair endonuclease